MTDNARFKVQFTADVVLAPDGGCYGVEMTCLTCGALGYKGAEAIVEHARTHPQPVEYVTISRQLMDHLEREVGLDPDFRGSN